MTWWNEKKHIFVREYKRLHLAYQDNNFIFFSKDDHLWLSGTLYIPSPKGYNINFDFELKYPKNYPFSIPYIYPKGREKNWIGSHQFISSAFCLDIRRKSWNSSLSSVDLLKSLEKLLLAGLDLIENKSDKLNVYEENEPTQLDLVTKNIKCIFPKEYQLKTTKSLDQFDYFKIWDEKNSRIIILPDDYDQNNIKKFIQSDYFKIWSLETVRSKKGIWIKTNDKNLNSIAFKDNCKSFKDYLISKKIVTSQKFRETIDKNNTVYILFFTDKTPRLLSYYDSEEDKVIHNGCYSFDLSDLNARIPDKLEFNTLNKKIATIMGCGSSGSYMAVELVKSGIGNIVLIDNDYLSTENILRHSCDLSSIGMKKIYALKGRLEKINPMVKITCFDYEIDIIPNYIEKVIKKSDIILNATVDIEEVINEFCWKYNIPCIHPKVYPLGFGGEIFRIIPNVTPCYECLSYNVNKILEKHPTVSDFPKEEIINYNETLEGDVLPIPSLSIDLNFISSFSVKLALDILCATSSVEFKNNVILWGNRREWIFDQDFRCIKIDTSNLKSYKNCTVCYGNKQIEIELNLSAEDVENIANSIKIENVEN